MNADYDVAIIGGGPSGSTVGSLLKKYHPSLRVAIFEREVFPRDHIGESLLPPVSRVLDEMGCWDKVEAANFPIKIGATYRWGKNPELWDVEFTPSENFGPESRPAKFLGQRTSTSFQVDRSIYDKILLDHAAELGCEVVQGTKVARIDVSSDRVNGLQLQTGETVTAKHYVDASGSSGILRKALEIPCETPTTLKNIAIYDYWQNADWAVEIGVGGTRIQVLTVGYGWLWFIPLGPTRTSIGLVVPVEYYKQCGKSAAELYEHALANESIIAGLLTNATCEGRLQATRDWSFLAQRHAGENWFLVGECAGFADPILSAGVTIAQIAAQQAACTILELERGEHDPVWLKQEFESRQSQRIRTHIRFGDYWYTANAQFKDLKDFTVRLAQDAGLDLSPKSAWEWLALGGFIDEDLKCGSGGFSLGAVKEITSKLGGHHVETPFEKFNVFKIDLAGASWKNRSEYKAGRVLVSGSYVRGDRVLPLEGPYEALVGMLQKTSDFQQLIANIQSQIQATNSDPAVCNDLLYKMIQALEGLISDGWVACSYDPNKPLTRVQYRDLTIKWNTDRQPVAPTKDPSPRS